MELKLKDFSAKNVERTADTEALRLIANKSISRLDKESEGGLLVFPLTFENAAGNIADKHIFDLSETEKDGRCLFDISTSCIIGNLGIEDIDIEIRSRFCDDGGEDYLLYYLIGKIFDVNILNLDRKSDHNNSVDLLLLMLPTYLNAAVSKGIIRKYETLYANDSKVRGVIDINRVIRSNIPFSGRISYRHREQMSDNMVTQLIRHAIHAAMRRPLGRAVLSGGQLTKSSVRAIEEATPSFSPYECQMVVKANLNPFRHPFYHEYTPLIRLCLAILRHEGLSYGADNKKLHGVVFDASWLWEQYLAILLKDEGYCHPDNLNGTGAIYIGHNGYGPRFPDFYNEEAGIVLDAKYKRNLDTRNDLNQIITYLYLLKYKRCAFVMPGCSGSCDVRMINGYGCPDGRLGEIRVSIPAGCGGYTEFCHRMVDSERDFLADLTTL